MWRPVGSGLWVAEFTSDPKVGAGVGDPGPVDPALALIRLTELLHMLLQRHMVWERAVLTNPGAKATESLE